MWDMDRSQECWTDTHWAYTLPAFLFGIIFLFCSTIFSAVDFDTELLLRSPRGSGIMRVAGVAATHLNWLDGLRLLWDTAWFRRHTWAPARSATSCMNETVFLFRPLSPAFHLSDLILKAALVIACTFFASHGVVLALLCAAGSAVLILWDCLAPLYAHAATNSWFCALHTSVIVTDLIACIHAAGGLDSAWAMGDSAPLLIWFICFIISIPASWFGWRAFFRGRCNDQQQHQSLMDLGSAISQTQSGNQSNQPQYQTTRSTNHATPPPPGSLTAAYINSL